MSKSNICVFVDIARQYKSLLGMQNPARINYETYLNAAKTFGEVHRSFAYGIQLENEATPFIELLHHLGYEPKFRSAKIVNGRPSIGQTSNNLLMFVDILRVIKFIDTIIIGSNDPELVPMINWIQEQGIKVIVFSFRIPNSLREAANVSKEIPNNIIEYRNIPQEKELS